MSLVIMPGAEASGQPAALRGTGPGRPCRRRDGRGRPSRRGRARPRRAGLADAAGVRRCWPPPTTSSATAPTSTGCRSTRGSGGTAATTGWRRSGPSSRSTWRCAGGGSPWSPPATRACSPWPRRCSRRPPPMSGSPGYRSRIVPGITAAQAVASVAGAPLGHDYVMLSLSDRLKPWDVIARRLAAAARGDFAIAIYNPASAVSAAAARRRPRTAARAPGRRHAGRDRAGRRDGRAGDHRDDPRRVRPGPG